MRHTFRAKTAGAVLAAAALCFGWTARGRAEAGEPSLSALAKPIRSFYGQMKNAGTPDFSKVMHPDEIKRVRSMLAPLENLKEKDKEADEIFKFFKVKGIDQIKQMSDEEFYNQLYLSFFDLVPDFRENLSREKLEFVASLPADNDEYYVIYKSIVANKSTSFGALSVEKFEVLTVKRYQSEWRLLTFAEWDVVPKAFQLIIPFDPKTGKREEEIREKTASLKTMRDKLSAYYSSHDGEYPADLRLLADRNFKSLPLLDFSNHPASREVQVYGKDVCLNPRVYNQQLKVYEEIDGSKIKDTGKWGYVGDKDASCYGHVFMDCTHPGEENIELFRY